MTDFLKRLLGGQERPHDRSRSADPFDLEQPLVSFSKHDAWRIKDACEGTHIFGATGSGKTTGSGQTIAKAFLRAGFGGLVLTAKPDECALWQRYARETGREESLIVVSPSQPYRFNFLDYEFRRPGVGAGITQNLVSLFYNVIEAAERTSGQSNDRFWRDAGKQLLSYAIDLLTIAKERVSLPELYDIITTAPQSMADINSEAWQAQSFCCKCLQEGEAKPKPPAVERDFAFAAKYWLAEFPQLAEKTRSIIVTSFTSMARELMSRSMYELFCSDTNIVPELTHEGVLMVIDLPVKEYSDAGRFAQLLFKYIWQRATERREVSINPRPVFLWADEAQFFTTDYDVMFQTTARSARAATVYLTQNLPIYYKLLGGADGGKAAADALLGNFQTKIFHANGDQVTNQWAAELFAKNWQFRASTGLSESGGDTGSPFGGGKSQRSSTSSQMLEYEVLPREFTTLRKGGRENGLCVDGILFQGGRIWNATGKNSLKAEFRQDI